jgi:hypothetical protein
MNQSQIDELGSLVNQLASINDSIVNVAAKLNKELIGEMEDDYLKINAMSALESLKGTIHPVCTAWTQLEVVHGVLVRRNEAEND